MGCSRGGVGVRRSGTDRLDACSGFVQTRRYASIRARVVLVDIARCGARTFAAASWVRGPLKDKDSRIVPVLDALLPILTGWKLKTGGTGRVLPPMRSDGEGLDEHTLWRYLRSAQDRLHLPRITWYQATRHVRVALGQRRGAFERSARS
jgi:hypothetical protein